jgi:hypothetical protein
MFRWSLFACAGLLLAGLAWGTGGCGSTTSSGGGTGTGTGGGTGGTGSTSGTGGSGGSGGTNPANITTNCTVFPADNEWNRDVSGDDVDANSDDYIAFILDHGGDFVHPDFGSNPDYGIPYEVVGAGQALVPITFTDFGDQSDPGPYPTPLDADVEAGSDGHQLTIDQDDCVLYELYVAERNGSGWSAASGAVFNLESNALRPDGWTSADAAGLPIFAGLVRYQEAVEDGVINHALRVTFDTTQSGYIHPATHEASGETDPDAPPMGLRLRLKDSFDISGFTGTARVILVALKKYGLFVADNGSNWYISGSTDSRWDDEDLDQLKSVPGSAFEVVEAGTILH